MKRNVFTSKANLLKFLQKKITKAKIEKTYDFTVFAWNKNNKEVLTKILKSFGSKNVIVRSSAIGEDALLDSQAGTYESILNVKPTSKNLKKAINKVIESYSKKGNVNYQNQVLIQHQSRNIITSGVIFTRDTDVGKPYYVINYDEGSSTIGVTKGKVNNIIKIFRQVKISTIPKRWNLLIQSVQEIESILQTNLLDIEFGITKELQVIIFQVRPITSIRKNIMLNSEQIIKNLIVKNKKKFKETQIAKQNLGKYTIFSDMADWNPAEIIGNNPHPLDYSLYNYLIMEKSWHQGRIEIGYQNVNPYSLMVNFGNKPYVDVRGSFNSLIPNNIKKRLKRKLINFYLNKLVSNPHLHDKVEFEILFTTYEIGIDSRLKELELYNFTKYDVIKIKKSLIEFTNDIINQFPKLTNQSQSFINEMKNKRLEIKLKLENKKSYTALLSSIEDLLKNCKKYGTIRFSTMARIAFIGSTLLKSLKNTGYLKSDFVDNFMNSLVTPLSDIQNDLDKYVKNQISTHAFLQKYGHLRPGTYDIIATRYDRQKKFFNNIKFLKQKKKNHLLLENNNIEKILKEHGLNFRDIEFFNFVKQSIVLREQLKFEFTKNISDVLELIAEVGRMLGFTRNDLAYLDIKTILDYKSKDKKDLQIYWKEKILVSKKKWMLNNFLVLPPIIFSEQDFEIIQFYISKPNFVTRKSLTEDIIFINNLDESVLKIENKIVLIENADPGYDWIFTKNPSGLITKYGGVASHMAIRCAEIGLPAAIGCGELLFEKLKFSSKILLDCKNEQIVILEHEKDDEYIEEKKVLKSLGYIK